MPWAKRVLDPPGGWDEWRRERGACGGIDRPT